MFLGPCSCLLHWAPPFPSRHPSTHTQTHIMTLTHTTCTATWNTHHDSECQKIANTGWQNRSLYAHLGLIWEPFLVPKQIMICTSWGLSGSPFLSLKGAQTGPSSGTTEPQKYPPQNPGIFEFPIDSFPAPFWPRGQENLYKKQKTYFPGPKNP